AGAMNAADVAFVQVKGPAPTPAAIAAAPEPPAFSAADVLMAAGRAASAFGVMRALGEPGAPGATEAAILADRDIASGVASVSGGIEVSRNEVVVLGRSEAFVGPLSIATRVMADALDLPAIAACCADLGLHPAPQLPADEAARVRAAFIKCEADRHGRVRGRPHTMLGDGDLNKERHIRGAVGAVAAAVLGDTALFVSGGAEHQGPDGGGIITIVAERDMAH
ncbi:MAG: ring-opening amidohydrolase, partial [Pseudomonadota bacterium]